MLATRSNVSRSRTLLCIALCLGACSSPAQEEEPTAACDVRSLDRQPTERFPVGSTFYLPIASEACSVTWSITSAPSENTNEVFTTGARARFTPTAPGAYEFELGEHTASIEVVDANTYSFHNLNYYPSRSIAMVAGELWAADVYNPSLQVLDPTSLEQSASVAVGSWPVAIAWREGLEVVAVAQRGADTIGIIDLETRTIVDAVWVGDEPANLVAHPTLPLVYTVLPTSGEIVVVDIEERAVIARAQVIRDPLGLAISPDGASLAVAAYRSGHPDRQPYGEDPREDELDVVILDAEDLEVTRSILDLGTTIRSISWFGDTIYAASTRNDTQVNLADTDEPSFIHEVVAIDPATGDVKQRADLLRQASSGGHAVQLYEMVMVGASLFVTAEASDLTIELDASDLSERRRVQTPGRPRGITSDGSSVFVHGAQTFEISKITGDAVTTETTGGADPRSEELARGQYYFTGEGEDYARNWSCNACHTDGLTDTVIWNAGPLSDRIVSRPFFWLEGTYPLGWAGYLSSVRNYAFTVNTNVGVRPDTPTFEGLTAYLSSLMPPPAANTWTERDGSLSEAALRGKALYEGEASCAGCHALPLTTNRARFDEGITQGVSDVPALVGSYRHNVWLKHGEARTMREAVVATLEYLNKSLTDEQVSDLTRYLDELTDRELFVLTTTPRQGQGPIGADSTFSVTFSRAIDAASEDHFVLRERDGAEIAADVSVNGRVVTLTPAASLEPSTDYELVVQEGVKSEDLLGLFAPETFEFSTARAATLTLEGEYEFIVAMPVLDFFNGRFDRDNTLDTSVSLVATPTENGATLQLDYLDDLELTLTAVIDGDEVTSEPIPVPIGPSFTDTTGIRTAKLTDDDGDGIADSASGTLVMSGPGFEEADVEWTLARPAAGCEVGIDGNTEVLVNLDEAGRAEISWPVDALALALYVTDAEAKIPLGPGQTVMGGDTYLALFSEDFPNGFSGPVTPDAPVPMGATDVTEENGGPAGGAPVPEGTCAKVYILFEGFKTTEVIFSR